MNKGNELHYWKMSRSDLKVLICLLFILIPAMVFFKWVLINEGKKQIQNSFVSRWNLFADLVAKSVPHENLFLEKEKLNKYLEIVNKTEDIWSISVADLEGSIVSEVTGPSWKNDKNNTESFNETFRSKDLLQITRKIYLDFLHVGNLTLFVDTHSFENDVSLLNKQYSYFVFAATFFVFFLIVVGVEWIYIPVRKLWNRVGTSSPDSWGPEMHMEINGELGEIARAVSQESMQIRNKNRELELFRRFLDSMEKPVISEDVTHQIHSLVKVFSFSDVHSIHLLTVLDRDAGRVRIAHVFPTEKTGETGVVETSNNANIVFRALNSGKIIERKQPQHGHTVDELDLKITEEDVQTDYAFPLVVRGEEMGVLHVTTTQDIGLSEESLESIGCLVRMVGLFVERDFIFREMSSSKEKVQGIQRRLAVYEEEKDIMLRGLSRKLNNIQHEVESNIVMSRKRGSDTIAIKISELKKDLNAFLERSK